VTGIVSGLFDAPPEVIVTVPRTAVPYGRGTWLGSAEMVVRAGVVPRAVETCSQGVSLDALQCSDPPVLVMRMRSERKTQFRVEPGALQNLIELSLTASFGPAVSVTVTCCWALAVDPLSSMTISPTS
jgi:hypothetical protein